MQTRLKEVAGVVVVVCTALVAAAEGNCFITLAGILHHPSCVHKLWQ